jgi:hypothetical protein
MVYQFLRVTHVTLLRKLQKLLIKLAVTSGLLNVRFTQVDVVKRAVLSLLTAKKKLKNLHKTG